MARTKTKKPAMFVCEKRDLEAAMRLVGYASPKVGSMVRATGERHSVWIDGRLSRLDMETQARVEVRVPDPMTGEFWFRADVMKRALRAMPGPRVQVVQEDDRVIVQDARRRIVVSIEAKTDDRFDLIESLAGDWTTIAEGEDLAGALARCETVASKDDSRPALTRVLLLGDADELRVASSDSYRLHLETIPAIGAPTGAPIAIPRKVIRALGIRKDERAEVLVSDAAVCVRVGSRSVVVKRSDDVKYPDFLGLAKTAYDDATTRTKLSPDLVREVRNETRRANMFLRGAGFLWFTAAEYAFELRDMNSLYEARSIRSVIDGFEKVAFNCEYLADAFRLMPSGDPVVVSRKHELKPVVFDAGNRRHVLMPAS